MRSLTCICIEYTSLVYTVNTYFTGCMDNLRLAEQDTYMCYPACRIIKKSKISAF